MREKEAGLKQDVREVHQSLQLPNMLRNAFKGMGEKHPIRAALARVALDAGAHMAIDRLVLKKKRGLGSYLVSAAVKKILSRYVEKHKQPENT